MKENLIGKLNTASLEQQAPAEAVATTTTAAMKPLFFRKRGGGGRRRRRKVEIGLSEPFVKCNFRRANETKAIVEQRQLARMYRGGC